MDLSYSYIIYLLTVLLSLPINDLSYLAAWNGHHSICKTIIEKLPDKSVKHVNLKDGIDNTPLHLAAERGHFEVCQLIMHSMVDVPKGYGLRFPKAGPDRDNTPYFLALFYGHKSVCNLLQWFPMYHPRLEKMKSHAESQSLFNCGNKYGGGEISEGIFVFTPTLKKLTNSQSLIRLKNLRVILIILMKIRQI